MIDRQTTALIRPALDLIARGLVRAGIGADALTFTGFAVGCLAALAIALQAPLLGAVLVGVSRLFDGLDGAVARRTVPTDRGGYLDISLDFLFYALIPLAFGVADPTANALAAAALLAGFLGNGSSFLAFSVIATKKGLAGTAYPDKSLYFVGGLTEATETLVFFIAMCLWPRHFALFAYLFASLCAVSIALRLHWAWRLFEEPPGANTSATDHGNGDAR